MAQPAIAIFAAGCFWGVEAQFRNIPGVTATQVGYTGGELTNPSYEDVCRGNSGHAEAVKVDFDPSAVSYEELLEQFWQLHDPTQQNRQGPDIGTQYRSVVFVLNDRQEAAATASRERAQQNFKRPIATEIVRATDFWAAEDYHQRYLEKRGLASCRI